MLCFIIVSAYRPHALRNLIKSIKKDNKFNLSSIFIVNDTPHCENEINNNYNKVFNKFLIKPNKILTFNGMGPNFGRNHMIEYIKKNFDLYTDFMLLDDDLEIPNDENNWIYRFYKEYKLLNVDILSCIWNCEKEGKKRMHCSLLIPDKLKNIHRHNIQIDKLSLCHIPLASFISNFSVFSKIQFSKDIKFYGDFLDIGYQILENNITCICNPHFYLYHRYFPNLREENNIVRFDPIEFNEILINITSKKYKYRNLITYKELPNEYIPRQFGFGKPKHFSDSWFVIERLIHEYISFNYPNQIGFFNSFCEFNHLYNQNCNINLPKNTFYISHLPISTSERFPNFNLNKLINEKRFIANQENIETIMCLSPIVKTFFDKIFPNKNIILARHPIIPFRNPIKFDITKMKKNIIFSGFFYRDEKPFINLKIDGFKKIWYLGRDKETLNLKFPEINLNDLEKNIDMRYFIDDPTELMNRLEDSIFMVHLIDATANNTILDCIQSGTPLLINRSEITEYYLGKDYPLFYNNPSELESLIQNTDLIKDANSYFQNMDFDKFSIKNIFNQIDMIYNKSSFYKKNKTNYSITNTKNDNLEIDT